MAPARSPLQTPKVHRRSYQSRWVKYGVTVGVRAIAPRLSAVRLAPASAATPCSMSVYILLHGLRFHDSATAARWMLRLCSFHILAPTFPAQPQLELNLLSCGCPWPFKAATGAWRVQVPLADPVAQLLLRQRKFLLRICFTGHRLFAR